VGVHRHLAAQHRLWRVGGGARGLAVTDSELLEIEAFSRGAVAFALLDEVRRLRRLIADTQDRNGYMRSHGRDWCAWCGRSFGVTEDHAADCPAFTPDGEVK
jgi:hypothetical protein